MLSAASAWEIAIKAARGRLELPPLPPERYVPERMAQDAFVALDIQLGHVLTAAALPRTTQIRSIGSSSPRRKPRGSRSSRPTRRSSEYAVETIW